MPAKTPGSEPLPPSPNEAILVRMGEWREGQGDTLLETRNLGPCIGLAIYEPVAKRGFLVHDPLPRESHSAYTQLEDHLRTVFSDQPGAFERMRVWLAGSSSLLASASETEAGRYAIETREFMVESMGLIGIPKESVEVRWTPDGHIKSDMLLDCGTGTCLITSLELPPES